MSEYQRDKEGYQPTPGDGPQENHSDPAEAAQNANAINFHGPVIRDGPESAQARREDSEADEVATLKVKGHEPQKFKMKQPQEEEQKQHLNLLNLRDASRQPAGQIRSGQAPVSAASALGVQKPTAYKESENKSAASYSHFVDEDEDHLSQESEYDEEDDHNNNRSVTNAATSPGEGQDDDAHEAEDIQQGREEMLVKQAMARKFVSTFKEYNEQVDAGAEDAASNKKRFIQKYGITCQIPSLYVQQSIIYHKDPQYSIQVLNYVLPDKSEYDVETHFLDGSTSTGDFSSLFKEKALGFTLRFVRSDPNLKSVQKLSEINIAASTPDGAPVYYAQLYFSKDCKYFMIYLATKFELRIFEIKNDDIMQLQQDIRDNNTTFVISKFKVGKTKRGLKFMERIVFDQNNRYFAILGAQKVAVFSYESLKKSLQKSKDFEPDFYEIDHTRYERICDIMLESSTEGQFECVAACKILNVKQVHLSNIVNMQIRAKRKAGTTGDTFSARINFFNNIGRNFRIKIYRQQGFLTLVVINGKENFIMQGIGGEEENCIKKNLNQIGDGVVHYISDYTHTEGTANPEVESIFIVASKEYDQQLHIYDSEDFTYDLKISRVVQPNTVRILDFHYSSNMAMQSLNDGEFMLDSLTEEMVQNYYSYASVSAFNVKWPYVSFSGLGNFLLLISAFSRKTLHRIEICPPEQTMKVCRTFITNTNDLFVVIRQEEYFRLLALNLDDISEFENMHLTPEERADSFKFKQLFQYKCAEVDYQPMLDLFARGSSRKEAIQLNHKLQVFFLHQGKLMAWIEGTESLLEIRDPRFKIISKQLQILDAQNFFFCQYSEEADDQESQISRVVVKFNDYQVNVVVNENSPKYDFQNFSIDRENRKLFLVLSYGGARTLNSAVASTVLKIFDMEEEDRVVLETEIVNTALQGILESNMFTLVDGHMYYNNNVFKVRYDLIEDRSMRNLTNEEVFNQYDDILELGRDQQIKMDTPLDSFQSHKFLYVVLNHNELQPKSLMILPYLHERKIHLNRIKVNTQYFYTSIFKSVEDQPVRGQLIRSQREHKSFAKPKMVPFIVCMNLAEHKFYTYSENGLLVNRYEYANWVVKYGEPIAASDDGQNFIFKKKRKSTLTVIHLDERELVYVKNIDISKEIAAYVEQCDPHEKEVFQKDLAWLDVKKQLDYDIQISNRFDIVVRVNKRASDTSYLDSSFAYGKMKRGQEKGDLEGGGGGHGKKRIDTIYLQISGQKILEAWHASFDKIPADLREYKESLQQKYNRIQKTIGEDPGTRKQVYIQYSAAYNFDRVSFKANRHYIFFWSKHEIHFFPLDQPLTNYKKVGLSISKREKNSYIKWLDCSPSRKTLAIVVENLQSSTVFQWDLEKNNEQRAFELDKNHQIIWGHDGNLVVLTKDKTILANEYSSLKCFVNDNFENRDSTVMHQRLNYDQGFRFDSENHNWLVLNEYISLSFCYMTFVIKNHLEEMANDEIESSPLFGRAFDQVAYNYLINRSTCFITGDLVKKKYLELQSVLQNFERIDPVLLEILSYKTQGVEAKGTKSSPSGLVNIFMEGEEEVQRLSALHAAVIEGNNRAIDILLTYMARIPLNSSENFKEILHLLADQQSFPEYLLSWTDQTQQMQEKNILRVQEQYTDEFVAIGPSRSTYVDETFYSEQMQEQKPHTAPPGADPAIQSWTKSSDSHYQSYPVNMQQLRVDWILNTDDGKRLLAAIHASDRLDFYEIPALKMIIEYIYQSNKMVMMRIQLPLYLLQGGLFFFAIVWTERIKSLKTKHELEGDHPDQDGPDAELKAMELVHLCVAWANQLVSLLLIGIMVVIFRNMGLGFFSRFYTWVDIVFYSLNTSISVIVLALPRNDNNQKIERILACFAVFLFLNKSFYYLKLVDAVAPFIDIIIQIFIDIKYFLMVFFIAMAALAISFNLLGRNQIDFDLKDEIRSDSPSSRDTYRDEIPYAEMGGALWYMWLLCLGAASTGSYSLGNGGQENLLTLLYILAQFFMIIHLLNMLIAIMGETFGNCKEVGPLVKIRDHLAFILDNWYLNQLAIPDKKSLVFIVTAFLVRSEADNDELLKRLEEQVNSLQQEVAEEQSLIIKRQLEQESVLHLIIKNQEKLMGHEQARVSVVSSPRYSENSP